MKKGIAFLKRYGPPGSLDEAPHGTICTVDNEADMDVYIQVHKINDQPRWKLMGTYPKSTTVSDLQDEVDTFKEFKF